MSISITNEELTIINDPIESAKGLPSRFYTGGEAMHLDASTTLAKTWTCLGYYGNLKRGSYEAVDLLGMPLVVVRGDDNTNRVFHNICRHRGHRLLESAGVLNGVIKCPYHSWIYDLSGSLKETPHINGYGKRLTDSINIAEYGLLEVKSDTWMGLTFVNLDGNEISLKNHLQPLMRRWKKYFGPNGLDELSTRQRGDSVKIVVKANWKLVVENYLESYHLPWVHPVLNRNSKIENHYNILVSPNMAGQGSKKFEKQYEPDEPLEKFSCWPIERAQYAEYIAVFPNLLLGIHIDHVFSVVLHPVKSDETVEVFQLLYKNTKDNSKAYAEAKRSLLKEWCSIFNEDILPLEGMQKGRLSKAFDGGVFSPKLETATHQFHKWAGAMYADCERVI